MGNVLKFSKAKQSQLALDLEPDKIKDAAALPKGGTVKAVFAWLLLIVRLAVFLVMYWLRFPVIFLCNLISLPTLLLWLFSLYAFPDKHAMVWGFGIISFLSFVLAWTYDLILMAISPQEMRTTL